MANAFCNFHVPNRYIPRNRQFVFVAGDVEELNRTTNGQEREAAWVGGVGRKLKRAGRVHIGDGEDQMVETLDRRFFWVLLRQSSYGDSSFQFGYSFRARLRQK